MKFEKDEKRNLNILLSERISQIYENINLDKKVRCIKNEKEKIEEKLEKYLKKETKNGFEIYCKCEEENSKFQSEIIKKYYLNGLKDGINLIVKNLYK